MVQSPVLLLQIRLFFFAIAETATIAEEENTRLLRLELNVGLEKGNDVEKGLLHPEAMKLFVMDLPLDWLGVFAFAQVGKSGGEIHGGAIFRPTSLFDDHPSLHLDVGFGAGLGAGGVPILGGFFRAEGDGFLFSTICHYHHITGGDVETLFRFRAFPSEQWFVEWWLGAFSHMAGKEKIFETFEGGPLSGIVVRWPFHAVIWLGWPFRRFEERLEPRFRLGVELEF